MRIIRAEIILWLTPAIPARASNNPLNGIIRVDREGALSLINR
jgi:hypothetical protein